MGCVVGSPSVTKELEESGVAILGKVGQKIEYPEGVVCMRIRSSEWSRGWTVKRLKTFNPTALVPLLEKKGATALYEQLKEDMVENCLGVKMESGVSNPLAWNRTGLYNLLKVKYNPMFKAKGLELSLCYVEWMIFFNETMISESRLWLEFCDLAVHPNGWHSTTPGVPGSNEYDPHSSSYNWEEDLKAFNACREEPGVIPKAAEGHDFRQEQVMS
jgi:hypothetical protein